MRAPLAGATARRYRTKKGASYESLWRLFRQTNPREEDRMHLHGKTQQRSHLTLPIAVVLAALAVACGDDDMGSGGTGGAGGAGGSGTGGGTTGGSAGASGGSGGQGGTG